MSLKIKHLLLVAGTICSQLPQTADAQQQKWTAQHAVLETRWAKVVSENTKQGILPLNEYPRPQLERKNWTNLNGLWEYALADSTAKPTNYEGQILVPYPLESALSGVKKSLLPEQRLWYKRSFEVKSQKPKAKNSQKERTLLNFGAVDYQCWVYVNGKEVGTHEGGYTAFSFDITDALKAGSNELVVKVYDPSDRGVGPNGKQVLNPGSIYYTPSSGIWQTVWLETVPETHISGLKLTPDVKFGRDADASRLDVEVNTNGNCDGCKVEIAAMSDNKPVANYTGNLQRTTYNVQLKNPQLWSPETPHLYDLIVRIKKGNKTIDEVKSYFGMRKVEIKKAADGYDRIFLNNKPYFNLGTLDQGFWPDGLYTAPTDEALKFDIEAIKAMGFNTIRKHIKVEPARWYYYADKMGMLVWQDMVNPNQGLPKGAKEAFEQQSKEILNQLHNYPSITTWVLFNERWGAYDQQRLTEWVKHTDPSRLVNGHSGELLYVNQQLREPSDNPYVSSDLVDYHSYPDPMEIKPIAGKASVIGEFGGIGVPVPEHQWDDLTGWGYVQVTPKELVSKYERITNQLKQLEAKGLSASIYTQPFDVEGEENGLLTYDRAIIKIPVEKLREIHASLNSALTSTSSPTAFHLDVKNIDAEDTDERYPELLQAFKSGKRDSAFLRRLTLMAIRQKDTTSATQISDAFIAAMNNPYTKGNLTFINHVTSNSKGKGFALFKDQPQKVDAVLGERSARKLITKIIDQEEIKPYFNTTSMDWEKIQKRVIDKYGEIGEEYIYGRQMGYYWIDNPNWDSLGKYYVLYFDKALKHSTWNINNVSWSIFEHIDDTEILSFAAKVSKYNMEHFDKTADAYDTYANLLYKSGGDKEEAIRWERKALDLKKGASDEHLFTETLEKMKKGQPTWPTNASN